MASEKKVLTGSRSYGSAWSEKASTPSSATPGGANPPRLRRAQHSKIHHILVRHEQEPPMADGYARATGGVGVASSHLRPRPRPTWLQASATP